MPNLSRFEALIREHAAALRRIAELQSRADELSSAIEAEKRGLQTGDIDSSPAVVTDEGTANGQSESAEADCSQEGVRAVRSERIVRLLQEYNPLEWSEKELADFLEVEPPLVTAPLRTLVEAGVVILKKGKFSLSETEVSP